MARPITQQPHPALINSLLLLATWYASPPHHPLPPGTPPPDYFLHQTRMHLANSLEHADQLISYIAASAFLSWWLLNTGRHLEARFEIMSTARLAIDCRLHQIDAGAIECFNHLQHHEAGRPQSWGILGPLTGTKALHERINIFWFVSRFNAVGLPLRSCPGA